jgi:hypothetical protein
MLPKILNSLFLSFCGLFLGGMAGYFLFSGTQLIRYFPFFTFLLILLILIYKTFITVRNFSFLLLITSLFSTIFTWFTLCCVIGLFWLFASEGGEFDSIDTIIMAVLMIFSMLILAFLIPVRLIWYETRTGQTVERILTELKPFLGMKKNN